MNKPLTSEQLERMEHNVNPTNMRLLIGEIERLADQLSDCWLLLDPIARHGIQSIQQQDAVNLLKKQQAPGWKDK